MYKLLNLIAALAIVPQVMSRQLKTDDSHKDWVELTVSQIEWYTKQGGIFLEPGQQITLGLKFNESAGDSWNLKTTEHTVFTVEKEIDYKHGYYFWTFTATEDDTGYQHANFFLYRMV